MLVQMSVTFCNATCGSLLAQNDNDIQRYKFRIPAARATVSPTQVQSLASGYKHPISTPYIYT